MSFLTQRKRAFAASISNLAYCNPFLPERIEHERAALGDEFIESGADWNVHAKLGDDHPNVQKLARDSDALATELADKLARGAAGGDADRRLYEDLALFVLYHRFRADFEALIQRGEASRAESSRVSFFDRYQQDADRLLRVRGMRPIDEAELAHLFACFYQIRRAFHHIFGNIIGVSAPAARFRAAVWQSIFTHDMRRYRRVLYDRMADFTTLITGPSGTGKELAARAIGLSRYVPFDPDRRAFTEDVAGSFHAVNLSSLSPTLIESELFGHRRGSFTGAIADHVGRLEVCPPLGTVFLDEIGDLDPAIQLKLLRVLQQRAFQRVGDTKDRLFHGKIIAATNRDLAEQTRTGRFREDFYYRLCSDMIRTPALYEQLRDSPKELGHLVLFIARRLVGRDAEALAAEVERFIRQSLDQDYAWPGNVRELEQCVRNVLIRKEYRPPRREPDRGSDQLADAIRSASLSVDELICRYCTLVYARTGSFLETARRIGLDRRTVKSRIDAKLLDALRRQGATTTSYRPAPRRS